MTDLRQSIDLEHITEFVSFVEEHIIPASLSAVRKYKLQKLITQFPTLYDLTISLSYELPTYKYTYFENYTNFDFATNMGEIIYAVLSDNSTLLEAVIKRQDYYVQKWVYLMTSKYFLQKFPEDLLLANMNDYYKLSDLMFYIEMPDVLEATSNNLAIQGLKRGSIEAITFPLTLFPIPVKTTHKSINYFVKKSDGSIVSNIISGKVREELLKAIKLPEFGVIGVLSKVKGFKRKYQFLIAYFNEDYNEVLQLYKGNPVSIITPNIPKIQNEVIKTTKPLTINNEDELKAIIKKAKNSKKYIVLTKTAIDVLTYKTIYDYAKIIDYIYNDEFEAIGLIISYKDNTYKIYFDVMKTNYVEGIAGKYVKIGVTEYKGVILKVFYNAEVKQWSKKYKECVICKTIRSKHYKNGVCNSCNYKIAKYCDELSGSHKEECSVKFDTLYYEDYEVYGDGEFIHFNVMKGRQMKLPLFDTANFC